MTVRDFTLLSESCRKRLEKEVILRVRHWADKWFCGEPRPISAVSKPLSENQIQKFNGMTLILCGDFENEWCVAGLSSSVIDKYILSLLTESGNSTDEYMEADEHSIINDVVVSSLTALGNALWGGGSEVDVSAEVTKISYLPKEAALKGSGVQAMTIRLDDVDINVAMSDKSVKRMAFENAEELIKQSSNEQTAMDTFSMALADRLVTTEALLGSIELPISVLATLNVGDVIQLDKLATEPMELVFTGTDIKCRGFLGQSAGKRAIRLSET